MTAEKKSAAKRAKPNYHHGDLRLALRDAALAILEKDGLVELSLRAVARKAGVSHAAPYRHYPNHEALLVELASEGFQELRKDISAAAVTPNSKVDRITSIGGAYMRFAARKPALAKLMFGPQIPNRDKHPELNESAESIGVEIGAALEDHPLGLAVWSAVHGLTMLTLDNVIDLGQRRSGLNALPSRAEILLRSLFGSKLD